jgi:hypothetical protein
MSYCSRFIKDKLFLNRWTAAILSRKHVLLAKGNFRIAAMSILFCV